MGRKAFAIASAAALAVSAAQAAPPPRKTPKLLALGSASFRKNCALCHGAQGAGDGPIADTLHPRPRNLATDTLSNGAEPAQVFETLSKGIPGTGMIAFRQLSDEERWALAYHVLELRAKARTKARGRRP
jgi:high-affinity iron transporter